VTGQKKARKKAALRVLDEALDIALEKSVGQRERFCLVVDVLNGRIVRIARYDHNTGRNVISYTVGRDKS